MGGQGMWERPSLPARAAARSFIDILFIFSPLGRLLAVESRASS